MRRSITAGPRRHSIQKPTFGGTSLVCARSFARAALSILDAVMVRYATSLPGADTKWSVANQAPRAFDLHRMLRHSWYFTSSEWTTIRLRLETRALTWLSQPR